MPIFLFLLLLCACGDTIENHYTITGTSTDASTDVDAQSDAAPETATDATIADAVTKDSQTQPDAEIDAQVDAPADTIADVVVDTAPDVVDAAIDTTPDAPPNQICHGRFEILDPGKIGFGIGSPECSSGKSPGRVKDLLTGLVWMRIAYANCDPECHSFVYDAAVTYCKSIGMRMPTMAETESISGKNFDECAFPCLFGTWIASCAGTKCNKESYDGSIVFVEKSSGGKVLCVK